MTLAEIIARHEQATVTPKGHAVVAMRRAIEAIRALDPHDQAETLAVFAGSLRAVIDGLARPEDGSHAS